MMKRINICLFLSIHALCVYGQKPFDLHTGDILFQTNKYSTAFVSAITTVTKSLDDLNFSHVGVALVEENGDIYVLEAIPTGMSKTPLAKFFKQSRENEGNPMVVVGRLKPKFRRVIPDAIAFMESKIGADYDYLFLPDNDAFYCSEIIYLAFRRKNRKPIFESKPMTFKGKSTGETDPYWIKHFERHQTDIPEGVEGTNPGDMSRSKAIKIVHYYF